MAPHSSTLAWKIPWMEEPGRLQSLGSQSRIRLSDFTFTFHFGEGNGNPLQCSCLENPRDGAAWWAAVCGVAQSRTRLEQLSRRRRRIQDWKRREWRRARGREERERERERERKKRAQARTRESVRQRFGSSFYMFFPPPGPALCKLGLARSAVCSA